MQQYHVSTNARGSTKGRITISAKGGSTQYKRQQYKRQQYKRQGAAVPPPCGASTAWARSLALFCFSSSAYARTSRRQY
eukprot:3563952-Rhodomonas_salina.1